jgi:adenylosuccinate lyase
MTDGHKYESPLSTRYASDRMQILWGPRKRARLWREIWLALATEQKALGLDIPDEALQEMAENLDNIDFTVIAAYEKDLRHDVMAHIHALGDVAPAARPFIHLGATSAFVTDNADMIVLREALGIVLGRLSRTIEKLTVFATKYRDMPTVAFTHFQPAQLTTVGKRATLWLQDLAMDAAAISSLITTLPCRGCKGTTGTQASYLELMGGDHEAVKKLDRSIATALDFPESVAVSGQTYTRKLDSQILDAIAGVAQTATKMATDLRLLQHEGEILEPFESKQIGSSAMPYKRNPMRTERICALGRYVISLRENTAYTVATQWFERTLDDSANRRLVLPDSFLATDSLLILLENVCGGLDVMPGTIAATVRRVMPFMATERWLMLGVQNGGDRQELHEVIRRHSIAVKEAIEAGGENDLVERLAGDPAFEGLDAASLREQLEPGLYVGRAPEQVDEFLNEQIKPLSKSLAVFDTGDDAEVKV